MDKLFDIIGGKVVIHPDALGIPCFKRIWDADKADKEKANNYISYLVLNNKYNSPYVKTILDPEVRTRKMKQEHFGDPNFELPMDVQHAENEYKEYCLRTLSLQLLESSRKKVYSIIRYYEDSLEEELDGKKVKDILAGIASLGNVIKSIDLLEANVKSEEASNTKVRGGAEVNPYELPNRKL